MLPKSPAHAVAVKKEEKEGRLKAFIAAHLASTDATSAGLSPVYVVARSHESPVVTAVAEFEAEFAARGAAIAVIFTQPAAEATGCSGWTLRVLTDPRLRDAHEQLVLGPHTAWIGDSMRREPLKRDAFECYSDACEATASRAAAAFSKLWQKSEAARATPCLTDDPAQSAPNGCPDPAALADQATDGGDTPLALTRQ